ncbi:hypothetical protein ACHAXR_003538 [Thalassiosira sp. AJA248-18]
MHLFVPDPSRYVPINPDLICGEEWIDRDSFSDDDGGYFPISFHVTLPTNVHNVNARLNYNFNCRDKSSGVLLPNEQVAAPEEKEDGLSNDPFFFERGFYLEAKTGFQLWPGSRLMLESFTCMKNDGMKKWQDKLMNNRLTLLEVGAGVGFVGTCLAASGGKVLLTDLPVLVEHGIWPNLKRNEKSSSVIAPEDVDVLGFFGSSEPTRFGEGWAHTVALDWFRPVSEQLSRATSSSIDVILGCDCLFLSKLVDPLLNIVSTLFQLSLKSPKFLFTYQRRNMMGVFIGLEELLQRIDERGWKVECLAWRTIAVEGDGEQDLYLFEVDPGKSTDTN